MPAKHVPWVLLELDGRPSTGARRAPTVGSGEEIVEG
jgi:hypothetical protein